MEDLLTGEPEDVAYWMFGDTNYDNEPEAMSNPEPITGFGYIVGWKWRGPGGNPGVTGFVLTPQPWLSEE